MSDLTNEFAWSHSRDRTFLQCHRQYWYSYYGHWGGWDLDAPADVRSIWFLKQLQSRHMWVGDLVHRIAEFALTYAKQHRRLPPEPDLLTRYDTLMREEFKLSRDDVIRSAGRKTTRLFEHEYDIDLDADAWRDMHRRGLRAVRNFFRSRAVTTLLASSPDRWMPIERFEKFDLDGTPVNVKLDFAYMDGDTLRILDWKTGARRTEPNTNQLSAYALFANSKWGIPVDHIVTAEVNLLRDEVAEHTVGDSDLERARAYISASAAKMRDMLDDAAANEGSEKNFGPVEELRTCKSCNFQRVCLGGRAEDVLRKSAPGRSRGASTRTL